MNNSDGIAIHKWFDDEDRLLEGRNEAYSEKLIFFSTTKRFMFDHSFMIAVGV